MMVTDLRYVSTDSGWGQTNRNLLQILVKIAFKRNWRSWFWKVMFPMDVITCVGFNAFLLLPVSPAGPSLDQRIAITTYLAAVLIAQVSQPCHA
jgi:hypothetical protein